MQTVDQKFILNHKKNKWSEDFFDDWVIPTIWENVSSSEEKKLHISKTVVYSHKTWLFSVIKKDFFSLPVSIRIVSVSMFLFIFGWGLWWDTFFSVYLKTIVDNVFRVSVIAAALPIVRMFLAVSVGELDDHTSIRSVIFLSKALYVVTSIFFFLAGIEHSVLFLVIAVWFNALSTATLITSYESLIRQYSQKENRSTSFGLYFSCINLAYVLGALLASVMVKYINLPYLFLFIAVFAVGSFISDTQLPHLSRQQIKKFLGKESFIHQFICEIFSFRAIKKWFLVLQKYDKKMFRALSNEFIFNILNYIGFIFIPIAAAKNNLTLSQIAIVFAAMRLPYVMNFFTWELADRYNKNKFVIIIFIFLSFLFALLWFKDSFGGIITVSFGIAFGLSLVRPVISWLVSDHTLPEDNGKITWVQQFIVWLGSAFGSILFGVLSAVFGMGMGFIFIWIALFLFGFYSAIRKFHLLKKL